MFENGGARGDNGPSSEASRKAARRYCGDGGMLVSSDSRSTRVATTRAEGANNTLECRMQHAAC